MGASINCCSNSEEIKIIHMENSNKLYKVAASETEKKKVAASDSQATMEEEDKEEKKSENLIAFS